MVEVGDDEGKVTFALEPDVSDYALRLLNAIDYLAGKMGDLVAAEERVGDILEAAFKEAEEASTLEPDEAVE